MRKVYKKRDEDAVSPVIATILMVAITVVLAAVLYVMVIGFGGGGGVATTGNWTQLEKTSATTAIMKFGTFSTEVEWTDLTITIQNTTSTWTMSFDANPPTATTITGSGGLTAVATDIGSNSIINVGDNVILTFTAADGEYDITIVDNDGNEVSMSGGSVLNMG